MVNLINKSQSWIANKISSFALLLILSIPGVSSADLLDNSLYLPLISFNSQGTTTYIEATNSFKVTASPVAILTTGNPPVFINPDTTNSDPNTSHLFNIDIQVDS